MKLLLPIEYQQDLESLFLSVRESVLAACPDAQVEHVGSSAIRGAISKGDLDVCVLVAPALHSHAVAALQASGYVIKVDTLRTPELCMLASPAHDYDVALQVVAAGSRFEFFMHFRDALCRDPALVKEYNALKLQYCDRPPNEYRDAKAQFIASVLGLV